jgi:hypothetical protein
VVDVDELVLEKVAMNVEVPGGQPRTIGKGRLVVGDGGMEFQTSNGNVSMRPVRSVEYVAGGVKVEFGEGQTLRTVYLLNLSKGALKSRSASKEMGEALRQRLQLKGLTEAEAADRNKGEAAVARAIMQKAKTQMWIWAFVAVAGAIATVISMSAASDGGGTYFVFWGAIVFGILGVLEAYFDRYRKSKKVLDKAGAPGAGAAA